MERKKSHNLNKLVEVFGLDVNDDMRRATELYFLDQVDPLVKVRAQLSDLQAKLIGAEKLHRGHVNELHDALGACVLLVQHSHILPFIHVNQINDSGDNLRGWRVYIDLVTENKCVK